MQREKAVLTLLFETPEAYSMEKLIKQAVCEKWWRNVQELI